MAILSNDVIGETRLTGYISRLTGMSRNASVRLAGWLVEEYPDREFDPVFLDYCVGECATVADIVRDYGDYFEGERPSDMDEACLRLVHLEDEEFLILPVVGEEDHNTRSWVYHHGYDRDELYSAQSFVVIHLDAYPSWDDLLGLD